MMINIKYMMPYKIVRATRGSVSGWRVRKLKPDSSGKYTYFSKKPLPKETAMKQLRVITYHTFLHKKQ